MNNKNLYKLLGNPKLADTAVPNAYGTAWVAMVPALADSRRPAWPQALTYLRTHQLADGGWGEPHVYYAHERMICTLAVLRAFLTWADPADKHRIEQGAEALFKYACDLEYDPYEPIGFELLFPALLAELQQFDLKLPLDAWDNVCQATASKLVMLGKLEVDYEQPQTWWFNMELLPEDKLAQLDDRILDVNGAIGSASTPTAAYLRALRLRGLDSPPAAAYLDHLIKIGNGGACIEWPLDVFELVWTLDSFMRAGVAPSSALIAPLIRQLAACYDSPPAGLSWNQTFPVTDGDDTAAGYNVLRWAGLKPSQEPLLTFWQSSYFVTFHKEYRPSVSANVHALSALRHDIADRENQARIINIVAWLRQHLKQEVWLHDKWHISPLYATTRAIQALAGLDDALALRCLDTVLDHQHKNGGWGYSGRPTLEETAYAVLGLTAAYRAGLLKDTWPLRKADLYLQKHLWHCPPERLWISKCLYQPSAVVQAMLHAARIALERLELARPFIVMRPGTVRQAFG